MRRIFNTEILALSTMIFDEKSSLIDDSYTISL